MLRVRLFGAVCVRAKRTAPTGEIRTWHDVERLAGERVGGVAETEVVETEVEDQYKCGWM